MESLEISKQLILRDYPQFRNAALRLNTDGWDNLVLIMDERVAFRIPRNKLSRKQLRVELHYLPQIAAVSPLPVPIYTFFSKEPGLYAGYELIPGQPFERKFFNECTKTQQTEIAKLIGAFLSTLHRLEINEKSNSKLPVRRQNRQSWLDLHAEVLSKAADMLNAIHKKKIDELFSYILEEIHFDELPKVLIHGDFSSDHIIYDPVRKGISGIIDFGDLMIGDPAYDFTGILLEYGRLFLDEVLEYYELPLDEAFLERIEQFYIPKGSLHQLLYAIEQGDERFVSQAIHMM